ncbi:MAG: hydroxymethylglutaryl-CoA synthase [Candidatus Aenigmarchaeota archaeon]|nr:hydroxymethylglutaryl-CoA synthase [Candidatus Aenigmarchaeota archaeon]
MAGIVGYGAYVPRLRITVDEIARIWGQDPESIKSGLGVSEKSVPEHDEDTVTISVEAAKNAIARAAIDPKDIGAVYVGSESHPYTVKPSGTIVVDSLGIGPDVSVADTEFACRAGTTNIFICMGLVMSGMIKYGLAIGADTSQARPGDALEYTAAAGGAAFVIGKDNVAVKIKDAYSFVTDTSDFYRKEGEIYPTHAGRFTGEPAYFRHVIAATKTVLEKNSLKPQDFDFCVFHMPNGKFPVRVAKMLGFEMKQLEDSLVVKKIGNTYSGSSLLGLSSVLDKAKPDQRILITSYGSGAGSDSFIMETTDLIEEIQNRAPKTDSYIDAKNKEYIDYGTYVKIRKKLKM